MYVHFQQKFLMIYRDITSNVFYIILSEKQLNQKPLLSQMRNELIGKCDILLKKALNVLQWDSRILASLTWLWFDLCRLKLISTAVPAASKNDARFKSGQKWLENSRLASLI